MKRSFALIALLVSGLALSAVAQTPAPAGSSPTAAPAAPPAGPAKIGVISFQYAVGNTNEGQRDFADLQKKYAPRQAQLKSLNDELDNLTKQLQTQAATLSEAERASRAKVVDEKKKRLDRETEDARNDFQNDMQEMYNALASKVYDVMQSYAEQQGYTLILDVSGQQSPVLYASDGTNITKPVIDAYNVKSGVPAQPAQSGAEAPRPKPTTPSARPSTATPKPPSQ
jgi:outer membrane protein